MKAHALVHLELTGLEPSASPASPACADRLQGPTSLRPLVLSVLSVLYVQGYSFEESMASARCGQCGPNNTLRCATCEF